MNCTDKMNAVLSELGRENIDLWYCTPECKEDWTKDYAIIEIGLGEAEYRDYDEVERELFDRTQVVLGKNVKIVHGTKAALPEKGYVLHVWRKANGLNYELELYRVKAK